MLNISTAVVGIVPMPKRSALQTISRELSEDVSLGIGTIGTLLVVEYSGLEKRPRGVGYTQHAAVVYGTSER